MTNRQLKSSKKISLGLILNRIFGSFFFLIWIIAIFSEPIPWLVMLIIAAILLPPITKLINKKFKFHLSKIVRIIVIILCLIIFGATVEKSDISDNQQTKTQKKEQTEIQNESVIATKKENKSITIPGISAVDIYGNLDNIWFKCNWPTTYNWEVFWQCEETTTEHSYIVEIVGTAYNKITSIQATALNYSSKSTKSVTEEFLWYIASVPYVSANPELAKSWVIENITQSTNKIINGVKFTIAGNERSRMLTISNENSNLD